MRNKRTHCKSGHKYTPDNTLFTSEGYQYCRTCHNERSKTYKGAKKSVRYGGKLKDLYETVREIVHVNPKVMRKQFYRASELKKMGIHCGIKAPQLNSDQADIRRMSA